MRSEQLDDQAKIFEAFLVIRPLDAFTIPHFGTITADGSLRMAGAFACFLALTLWRRRTARRKEAVQALGIRARWRELRSFGLLWYQRLAWLAVDWWCFNMWHREYWQINGVKMCDRCLRVLEDRRADVDSGKLRVWIGADMTETEETR